AFIKRLDQRKVQGIDAFPEDPHAAVYKVGIIRSGAAQPNPDLTVRISRLRVQKGIHKLLCLIDKLLDLRFRPIQRTSLAHIIGSKGDQKVIDPFKSIGSTVFLKIQPAFFLSPEGIGLPGIVRISKITLPFPAATDSAGKTNAFWDKEKG